MKYKIEAWSVGLNGEKDKITLRAATDIGYKIKRFFCRMFYDYTATTMYF